MNGARQALQAHLQSGLTTTCRCWAITRSDGQTFGFTDHDMELSFDGLAFKASTGLTAAAIEQATGLSIDNTEAMGALSDASVREEDIEAGRFDGAEVRAWLVNWADAAQRMLQFRGSIGELRRAGGAFHAELRGLTDLLNRPLGRIYQKPCTAVLGDGACRFALDTPGYRAEAEIDALDGEVLRLRGAESSDGGWFERDRLDVLDGAAQGLWASIKLDEQVKDGRNVTLWSSIGGGLAVGDRVQLTAGCDKRMTTCRLKFNNMLNFQGFPDLPHEDWVMAVPKRSSQHKGGSRR
ncbi:phage conserved hypothetical protein BR0599 [Ruegeria halocynthiae]|uniref:Bacteriophage phiJL001 Gp84 C-terminal domain-containing protein n=1 Tax=Ruegeria halocynthiae TaxID=985054 RepID=A0A1H2SAI8_9RHOB|nr:DUF2163 domain-containing protein [Ruegeria halocynthiae]SDW28580.1 phage conserved hypothetical protein BR0599 [Ruegeria halocynthiae]